MPTTLVYSDPSAAHERALRLQADGAYRVQVTRSADARWHVTAYFREAHCSACGGAKPVGESCGCYDYSNTR